MKITMLGTGTSYPDIDRAQSGILVEEGEQKILLDIGAGVLHRLVQTGTDLNSISNVFISHFHIDHCSDFLPLCQSLWLSGFKDELSVFGPPFLNVWLKALQEIAFPYLTNKVMVRPRILEIDGTIMLGELEVTNTPTVHGATDTRALKIKTKKRTIVYSSDTAPSKKLNEFAMSADVLIHECNWLDGDHPDGVHTSPSELAKILEETSPKIAILTHLSPEVVSSRQDVLDIVASLSSTKVSIAEDLMTFTI